ncbi:MAG: CGNR zinc finger domain-containing protein [Solirubrobacteraceae bacterium]
MTVVQPRFASDEKKPAPMPLLVVQGFVNTLDLEEGTDVLADADGAREWFIDAGLLDRAASASPSGLSRAREVRESLRWLLRHDDENAHPDEKRLAPLRALTETHRARLTLDDGGAIGLENARHQGLDDGLFELLLIVRRAQEDGSWARLKVCTNPDCRWAFFDRSRNQQGSWCDMALCGNRLKNRELRARRR